MRTRLTFAICVCLLSILCGCSQSYRWEHSHPSYKLAPKNEIAITGLDEAFVVTRSSWFAKRLDISKDSIQTFTSQFCAKTFLNEIQKLYPTVSVIPDKVINQFPEESQKLDTRIFIKGHLPEQGISVKDSAGNVPSNILIIHEFILGTDLKREDFYDYALIHNESPEKKTSQNLSVIVSFSLWDNIKQRSLYSAVIESEQPIVKLTLSDIEKLTRTAALQIRNDLTKGVH